MIPTLQKRRVPPNRYIYLHRSNSWQLFTVTQKFVLEQNFCVQASRYFVCTFHQIDKSTWIKMWFLQCIRMWTSFTAFPFPYWWRMTPNMFTLWDVCPIIFHDSLLFLIPHYFIWCPVWEHICYVIKSGFLWALFLCDLYVRHTMSC